MLDWRLPRVTDPVRQRVVRHLQTSRNLLRSTPAHYHLFDRRRAKLLRVLPSRYRSHRIPYKADYQPYGAHFSGTTSHRGGAKNSDGSLSGKAVA